MQEKLNLLFKKFIKRLRYFGEAAIAYPLYVIGSVLPLDAASWLGGAIARSFGPFMKFHDIANKNLKAALPEMSDAARKKILRTMWDNIGRVMAEYTHIDKIWDKDRIEVVNQHIVTDIIAAKGQAIFIGAHLGNWEVGPVVSEALGLPAAFAYRKPNNEMVGKLLRLERQHGSHSTFLPKGSEGARGLLRHLLGGGSIGLLIDQKMNDGIPVPFFGRDTMTASAAAKFALRTGTPLIPMRTERLKGAHFRITFYPPVDIKEISHGPNAEADIMVKLNGLLESWIRSKPEQWLWLHRRWGKMF